MFILTRIEDREAAEAKAIAVQQEAQMQQVRAVQFAEYAARQQQVEIEEEQEQIEEDEVVAANDNAIAAANDNEIQEEAILMTSWKNFLIRKQLNTQCLSEKDYSRRYTKHMYRAFALFILVVATSSAMLFTLAPS